MTETVAGVAIPDSALAREATELAGEAYDDLLFHHCRRVFLLGSLHGRRLRLAPDPELLHVGAMFHDLGLTPRHRRDDQRFEMDGADEARRFLRAHGIPEERVRLVWEAVALHTTPEVPWRLEPEIALVTAGVETDVMGVGFGELDPADLDAVVAAHPRPGFKTGIVDAFAAGFGHRPGTTFGTMNGDVLEHRLPGWRHTDFVEVIRDSPWSQ